MSIMIQRKENTAAIANFIQALITMGGGNSFDYFGMEKPNSLVRAFADVRMNPYDWYVNERPIYLRLRTINYVCYEEKYKDSVEVQNADINSANFEDYEPFKDNVIYKRVEYSFNGNNHYVVDSWHYKMLKMIQFYLYQCEEEYIKDVPEFVAVIEALKEVEQMLMRFIVMNSNEYCKYEWA